MAASQLTSSEQQIYDALERETSSINSIRSLTDLAKVLAKVFGSKSAVYGQIMADTILGSTANFHMDFANSFAGFETILENITLTGAPEKFIVPSDGRYLVSYETNWDAVQNTKGSIFPTKNNVFLDNNYYRANISSFNGQGTALMTFGKTVIMELVQNDQIGMGGKIASGVLYGSKLQIMKL